MDCRKLIWLGGLAIGGLIGCRHQAAVKDGDPYSAVSPQGTLVKAPAEAHPPRVVKSESSKEVSHVLDAKPESCVKIGDLKSEIALDKNRSDEDRATAARQAKNAYHRALQLDPKHLSAYLGLARLSMWLGEYDEAMKTYDTALAKFPKEAIVWYEHGMCLARQKKLDEALPNLQKAAKLEPANAQYSKGVGLLLARLGKADEAISWLMKSMPEEDARYNVARMMEHIGRRDEADRQLKLALKANPNHQPTIAMLTGASPEDTAAEPIRQINHESDAVPPSGPAIEQPPPIRIEVGSSLPSRPAAEPSVLPAPAQAEPVKPVRAAPVIPVVSDQWEEKPAPPAPLDGPRAAPRAKPNIKMGFDPNS